MSGVALLQGLVVDPDNLPDYGTPTDHVRAPVSMDQNGRLIVAPDGGGGSVVVVGTQTPGDAVPNPTDCLDTRSFPEMFDGTNWRRMRASTCLPGGVAPSDYALRVVGPPMVFDQSYAGNYNPVAGEFIGVVSTNVHAMRVTVQAPHAFTALGAALFATQNTPAQAGFVKASQARLLGINGSNSNFAGYFVVVNKASAPVNSDPVVLAIPMNPSDADWNSKILRVGREFFGDAGMHLSAGLAWAWSSTPSVVTLAGPPGAMSLNWSYT